ncbi:MAG: ATP-binding protein [Armatimonadetes bacterium]|nr:ATP-binding protein [Armatimonadota bacterium]
MIARHLRTAILEGLQDSPVVLLHGPRQAGKSTLVRELAASAHPAEYVTLDDALTLAQAEADAEGFLRQFEGAVAIDEVQRVPALLLAIKASVDRDRRPGRYVLTGSANVLTVPRASESLAGRMEIHRLWPFAEAELQGQAVERSFIDRVMRGDVPRQRSDLTRSEVVALALRGGFPEAVQRTAPARREAWFSSYLTALIQRDVRDLANITGLAEMPRLLQALAARSAGLLNRSALASDVGLEGRTLGRYLALLEMTFVVSELPAWHRNVTKRLMKAPKLVLNDTGLMGHLLQIRGPDDAERDVGALLETLVASELRKQAGWATTPIDLYHFRTYQGREVDLVLQRGNRELVGLEVKSSSKVTGDDFKGLRELAELAGDDFVAGIVLHTGSTAGPFGDRLWAIPIGNLWMA